MAKPLPAEQMAEGHGARESARERVVIRSAYDGSRVQVRLICTEDEDRTQQAFRDECDINVLMKRYEKTGILPVGRELPPQYADVTSLDFMSSMQRVAEVSGVFSMLDARTRARFENDPARMLDFLADPGNMAEAVSMGLVAKPKEVERGRDEGVAGAESAGRVGSADETGGESERGVARSGAAASGGVAAGAGAGGAGQGGQGRSAAVRS